MFQVDPRFQQGRKAAKNRHRKRLAQRLALFGLLPAALLIGGLALFTEIPQRGLQLASELIAGNDDSAMLVQVDGAVDAAPVVRANVFLNIAGDPTLLRKSDQSSGAQTGRTEGSGVFDIARFGLPTIDRFVVIRDDLVVTEKRLMIELPSSREDFAFFLAQRDQAEAAALERGLQMDAALQAELAQLNNTVDLTGFDSGDYELDGSTAPAEAMPEPAVLQRNSTSIATTRREADRRPLFRDAAILIELDQPLPEVLAGNGVAEDQAGPLAEALASVLTLPEPIPRGAVIGLRFLPLPYGGERLGQVSLYLNDTHAGTAWLDPQGRAIPATDPWLDVDLPALARAPEGEAGEGAAPGEGGNYRMLDAIYSAAVRDGVPAALAGELISILSRSQDLERSVTGGDKVTMAYSNRHGPGGRPAGQWLYVGIEGPSGVMQCYILPDRADGGYRCASPGTASNAMAATGGGVLQTPVAGVMSSRFGPRNHPILKTVRLHAGLDWAAPTGTPIRAAAAGKVALAAESGAYGNLVVLTHPNGLETRYAHMNAFAPGLKPGDIVQVGQVIGEVGTTGLSTGAHLHFELRQNGAPVDPLPFLTGAGSLEGSSAVEALVARIIQVESGGQADAKNPLSTATGLGQFIESTWLRMMRTYRPDLVATMGNAELLALRTDPTLSREMVKRLAEENEAYLRARGHAPSSGMLYLAHFLGSEGAHRALSASDEQTVLAVMGAGVVSANPFLKNYTIADLKGWSNRKMQGPGAVIATAPAPPPVAPEIAAFMRLTDDVLAATKG